MRRRVILVLAVSLSWTVPLSAAAAASSKVKTSTRRTPPFVGVASWYGRRHEGKRMANGQRFHRHSLTAACRSLPLGTRIRVVNLENGRVADVTVTDRGPAKRLHRVLDLSEAAARELDFIGRGETRVFFFPLPEPVAIDLVVNIAAENAASK